MFGNPNISNTPVDDLYTSQADTYGNSFANPVNPANMNSGWGIDSSLLSPSYTAGFRPGYSGSNGAVAGGRPGFFGAINNLSPWSDTPSWGNPIDHHQANVDSVASRPVDAGMWAAQRIAMPVAGMYLAGKALGGYNALGMSKGGRAMGRSFGRGLGSGVARGLGGAKGGLMARGLGSAMGGVMGAAAGWALPIAAAGAVTWAGEKIMTDPYINTRRSAEDLRDNFAGISFGDSQGNSVSGGGLGGFESAQMGRKLTTAGIRDMSLSTGQYTEAASMISRSGLTDNVNSKDITKRIQESTQQMKLIMSIANMPEMKDAIEQLSKLQRMGANVSGGAYSDAAGTMRQLGGLASVAGTNVQKLMNTVGAQGQYLYQANGMTPYLGQMAAANNYASLSAGNRQGLISSAQLARLGGLDGAAQASMTGELNASQTTYNKISNYNRYMGAGAGGGAIGTLQKFGHSMTNDPMGTQGAMMLYGNQMAGIQMSERGSLALDDQIFDMLRNIPGMIDSKTGKIALEKAVPYMTQMGMSTEQIQAYATKRVGETDQGTYDASLKGLSRNHKEQQRQLVEQHGLYGGTFGRAVNSVRRGGREFTAKLGDTLGGGPASLVGKMSDSVGSVTDSIWFEDSIKNDSMTIDQALAGERGNTGLKSFDTSTYKRNYESKAEGFFARSADMKKLGHTTDIADQLNAAKDRGDANAIAYFKASDSKGRQGALNKFKESGQFSKESHEYLSDNNNYRSIEADLESIGKVDPKKAAPQRQDIASRAVRSILETIGYGEEVNGPKNEKAEDVLARVAGRKGDVTENARLAGRAYDAATSGNRLTNSNIEERLAKDKNLQEISKQTGITDPLKLLEYIEKTSKGVADEKLVGLTTNSLKVKGSGTEAFKAAGALNGGTFRDQDAIETKDLSYEDSMMATLGTKENILMKGKLQDALKSGKLDFSGYQGSMNALQDKESVAAFAKGVKEFVQASKNLAENTERKKEQEKLWFGGVFSSSTQKSQTSGQ